MADRATGEGGGGARKATLSSGNVLALIAAVAVVALLVLMGLGMIDLSAVLGGVRLPAPGSGVSLLALFIAGLFTGVHCIGMCGAFVAASAKTRTGLFLYLSSKTLSYTLVGALLGGLGQIVSISATARSFLALLAGAFLILWGLNALHVGFARRLFCAMPNLGIRPDDKNGPVMIGLLTGFLPCGPMLAVQAYALGTGSALAGALSMLAFGLGTVPLLAVFGTVVYTLDSSLRGNMFRVSALIMLAMGAIMAWQSIGGVMPLFSGTGGAQATPTPSISPTAVQGDFQVIRNELYASGYRPATIYAKAGKPIHWIIDVKEMAGCNAAVQIPSLGIRQGLHMDENEIDLPALPVGTVQYACGMNMLHGSIIVEE